jgi:hypothetical protein
LPIRQILSIRLSFPPINFLAGLAQKRFAHEGPMMKHIALGLLAVTLLAANSGCCCLWKKLHGCGHGCAGYFDHSGPQGCCDTHYLNPHGAHYGASCGNCCEQWGCGEKYCGDCFVPYVPDPCDCCGNWIGHGAPAYHQPGYFGSGPWGHHYAHAGPGAPQLAGPELAERQVGPTKVVEHAVETPAPKPQVAQQRSITRPGVARRAETLRSK